MCYQPREWHAQEAQSAHAQVQVVVSAWDEVDAVARLAGAAAARCGLAPGSHHDANACPADGKDDGSKAEDDSKAAGDGHIVGDGVDDVAAVSVCVSNSAGARRLSPVDDIILARVGVWELQ